MKLRSGAQPEEFQFDVKIERINRQLRAQRRRHEQRARERRRREMGDDQRAPPNNAERTLRETVFPNNGNLRPLGITLPVPSAPDWELKHAFMQLLPKFSDMPGEDPQRHLQDFEMTCYTVRTQGNMGEYIRLLAFPFSLQDGAKEWLYTLEEGSVTTWAQLQQKFLEKYYPASRIQNMRKRISSIKMGAGENFYEYWGRFKQLLAKSPQHAIAEPDLVQYFMMGLRPQDRALVNAACGGSVLNKLPSQAMKLFADMAEETLDEPIDMPRASPVERSASDAKLDKMCTLLEQIVNMNGP